MRPFTGSISERSRQKYGNYQPRYQTTPSMRVFTAPISDRRREMYGEFQPRYQEDRGMRPFDAEVSDRSRELFGEHMRRYETTPSMSAFDSEIGSYKRDLYGEYRPRHSAIKVAQVASTDDDANGMNWVDMTWDLPWYPIIDPEFDISIYQYTAAKGGSWAGIPMWRMMINDLVVFPFPGVANSYLDTTGSRVSFGSLSVRLRMGDTLKMQFMSTNAGDGVGDWLMMDLYYVTWEP